MAAVSDCFTVGSTVACTTCFHKNIEGEVLAFHPETKMLILKCHSKDSVKLSDVYIVNLSLCSDVQVKKESNTISEPKQSLDLQRLSRRVRNAIEQKKILVSARQSGVSPEGQKLYMAISKTISNQVDKFIKDQAAVGTAVTASTLASTVASTTTVSTVSAN